MNTIRFLKYIHENIQSYRNSNAKGSKLIGIKMNNNTKTNNLYKSKT